MALAPLLARSARSHPFGLARTIGRRLKLWRQMRRELSQLARMTDRELRDIGLTRTDAVAECRMPLFWPCMSGLVLPPRRRR